MFGFLGTEQFVYLFFGRVQGGRDQQISLLGFGLFGFHQRGAHGRGEFLDDVFRVGDQLRTLLDESSSIARQACARDNCNGN